VNRFAGRVVGDAGIEPAPPPENAKGIPPKTRTIGGPGEIGPGVPDGSPMRGILISAGLGSVAWALALGALCAGCAGSPRFAECRGVLLTTDEPRVLFNGAIHRTASQPYCRLRERS
jgi:hypothetical protein